MLKAWLICLAFCAPFLAGGIYAAMVGLPPILNDYAVRNDAREVPGSFVTNAVYRTHNGFTSFRATLVVDGDRLPQEISFIDFSGDQYATHVVASPAKPGYFTTDLALRELANRAVLGFGAVAVCFLIAGAWIVLAIKSGARMKIFAAYSGRRMEPVAMRILGREVRGGKLWWQLRQTNQRSNAYVTHRDKLYFILADGEHVLGVRPAGSDGLAYPVDAALAMLNLSESERREVLPYAARKA